MGAHKSRPVMQSPSAAFGRLRIDSPRYHRQSPALSSTQTASRILPRSASHEATTLLQYNRQIQHNPQPGLQNIVGNTHSFVPPPSPLFIVWIGPALFCALAYALYNIFIKKGSATMNPVLGGVILQFVAALFGTVLLLGLVYHNNVSDNGDKLDYDKTGVLWSIAAGAAVGAAELSSFYVSGQGVPAMQSIPIIIGGSVLFGTILGYSVLHEDLTPRGWVGVLLIAGGIALVGTDPGGAGSVH